MEQAPTKLRRLLTGYVEHMAPMEGIRLCAQTCADQEVLEDIIKEIKGRQGLTAVHVAVRHNFNIILDYLLVPLQPQQKRGLLMTGDAIGNLPIHHAALEGNGSIMKYLHEYFESDAQLMEMLTKQNDEKENATHCAMAKGHQQFVHDMLQEVKKRDADTCMKLLECKDVNDDTPIHRAAAAGHNKALKVAMTCVQPQQKQELLGIRNGNWETPMEAATAVRNRLETTIELLGNNDDAQ